MRLSYQPLTRRWRLQVSPTPIGNSGLALGQNFDTREEALAAVQRISRWKIADAAEVDPDAPLQRRLPLPARRVAAAAARSRSARSGQADWNIAAARNQRLALESARVSTAPARAARPRGAAQARAPSAGPWASASR